MSNAIDYLKRVSFDNKKWITDLRNIICQNGSYSDEDITTAIGNFTSTESPNEIEEKTEVETESQDNSIKLLYRLYENKNLAGTKDNQDIVFSPFFTLVYGKNGSGKSTYYKTLKSVFSEDQNIKNNIYTNNTDETSVKIDLVKENEFKRFQKKSLDTFPQTLETISWSGTSTQNKNIKFCDNDILNQSLSKRNASWSVDRYRLDYYETMREAIDTIKTKAEEKKNSLTLEMNNAFQPFLSSLKDKQESSVFSKLSNTSSKETELQRLINLEEIDSDIDAQIDTLNEKANVNVETLVTSIKGLETHQRLYTSLISYIDKKILSCNSIEGASTHIEELVSLKNSRDFSQFNQHDLLFSLENENQELYINLLKDIAKTALSYQIEDYPDNVEKCFYCNQDLPEENKSLIKDIHSVIDENLENRIDELEHELMSISSDVEVILDTDTSSFEILDLTTDVQDVVTQETLNASLLFENTLIEEALESISDYDIYETFSEVKSFRLKLLELKKIIETQKYSIDIKCNEEKLNLQNIEINKSSAKAELNTLHDKKYCFENKTLLQDTLNKTITIKKFNAELSRFNTYKTRLSNSKSKVEDTLIRNSYKAKFNGHLNDFRLPKRDKIKRKFSVLDGQTKIEGNILIQDNKFKISDILSEGEAKVYSLCDWFTELEFSDSNTVIFDDPLTSLDEKNVENLAKKICQLSNTYQVIIFTHNIQFYKYLVDYSLGNKALDSKSCKICEELEDSLKCEGYKQNTQTLHKCGNYLRLENTLHTGTVKTGVLYNTLRYKDKMLNIRQRLTSDSIEEVPVDLRNVINDFIEQYYFADIKREIFKNLDMITLRSKLKPLSDETWVNLQALHNRLSSSSGTLHSYDHEINTTLEHSDYIEIFNDLIDIVNSEANQSIERIN
ncbi:hypothetical protein LXN10_13985 [Arcobacter sp. KX21116]|uniref:AAA family ATPase n=1 Tax=Arcobacter iocasae TaxID=2906515 RepID=UPI0035D404E5